MYLLHREYRRGGEGSSACAGDGRRRAVEAVQSVQGRQVRRKGARRQESSRYRRSSIYRQEVRLQES
jgi:hypothetical protein